MELCLGATGIGGQHVVYWKAAQRRRETQHQEDGNVFPRVSGSQRVQRQDGTGWAK